MDPQSSQSTRPRRKSLTRDQRVAVQTLRRYGLSLQAIANQLQISLRQVQYACQRSYVSDTRSPGRPPVLSSDQTDELVEYIRSSEDGRFMTYFELAIYPFAHWNVGEIAIRGALRRRGYRRCISQCKPPLTPENMQKRLLFARTHRDWTIEQWSQILWTNESWITGGQHRREWVTRLVISPHFREVIFSLMKNSSQVKNITKIASLQNLPGEMAGCSGGPIVAHRKGPY
ncbi:hypothetical protein K3495_g8138 [Podosphaera aphanis]|nr:hypothetical protein K3495_g8138 [Podosphaera aphanis]